MKAKELTQAQREEFAETFYRKEPWGLEDKELLASSPWGCPWYWGSSVELSGDTIEEMVRNFIEDIREEVEECLAEEKDAE